MTVVGLHPEELFDKLLEGELNPAERARLRVHLETCDVCRFEYAARADFQAEALSLGRRSPPPLLPLRTPQAVAAPGRRSRVLVWGLAAAALITASGAVAGVVAGKTPWQSVSSVFSRTGQPVQHADRVLTESARRGTAAAVNAAEPAVAPVAAAEQTAAAQSRGSLGPKPQLGEPARLGREARPALGGVPLRKATRVASPVVAVTLPAEPAAKEAAAKELPPAAKLFTEANQARRAGDIGRASGLYHVLQDQFPGSAEAELSRVTLALLLLDSGDAQSALTGFERYLAGPSQGLEAEALVGRARSLGRLGRRDLEATAWQEVQRKYPRSIYGRQATERLSALGLP